MRLLYVIREFEQLARIPENTTILKIKINLRSLPRLPDSLKELHCQNTKISRMINLPSELEYLDCSDNNLNKLPDLPSSLRVLICRNNPLIILPKLPNSLRALNCSFTNINSIPELPDLLDEIDCSHCKFQYFPPVFGPLSYVKANNNPFCKYKKILIDKSSTFETNYLGFNFLKIENIHHLYERINYKTYHSKVKHKEINELKYIYIKNNIFQ
jgi:Leucine-rich repeat (LRR) protein